jgi:hypothetical protein
MDLLYNFKDEMEVNIMSSALVPTQSNQGLYALDPNLPFLASEAAVDIDNLLFDRPPRDLTAMRRLAGRLNNSVEKGTPGGALRSLMDPVTLTVLGEAMENAGRSQSLQTVEDLLGEADKIAVTLSKEDPKENSQELEQARDFCVSLSRAVMTYHKSIRDLRPSIRFGGKDVHNRLLAEAGYWHSR